MKPAHISYFMYNRPGNNTSGAPGGISLQHLLNKLLRNLHGTLIRNNISVENEVPYNLNMPANQVKVLPVINELLTTVLTNAHNTNILLTPKNILV